MARPLCASLLLAVSGCDLEDAAFGRPCVDDVACGAGYRCFATACVPEEFPLQPTGERCVDALPLALGASVSDTTAEASDDATGSCGGEAAPEHVYVVDLPREMAVVVRLEVEGFDAVVYAQRGCGVLDGIPDGCADDPDDAFASETLLLSPVGPGPLLLFVDGVLGAAPSAGGYTLTVSEQAGCPLGGAPLGDTCVGVIGSASMASSRTNTTATLLLDGRVLVAGGRADTTVSTTATAELYLPDEDRFVAAASMGADRARHAAALLQDGRVLVAGGVSGDNGSYVAVDSVELFDPDTASFSDGPPLPSARDLFTLTTLPDGRVLLAGGRDGALTLDDVWLLDAGATQWIEVDGGLVAARFGHTATALPDGDVLLAGGRQGPDSVTVASVEVFDVDADAIVSAAPLPRGRGGHVALPLDDGSVLVASGFAHDSAGADFVSLAAAHRYDVESDSWLDTGDVQQPRQFAAGAPFALGARRGVLLLGGDLDGPRGTVEVFDPASGAFVALPSLGDARLSPVAVELFDGSVLVIGGDGGFAVEAPLASAERYGVLAPVVEQ